MPVRQASNKCAAAKAQADEHREGKADVREASRRLERAEKSGNKWQAALLNRTITTAILAGSTIALSSGPVPTMRRQ